jgi:PD-(D/E)XK nuclease superfamily
MAIPKTATQNKPITSWSISRYNAYQKCPFLFACEYVWKVPSFAPESAALVNGRTVHDAASGFLLGTIAAAPKVLGHALPAIKRLRAKAKKEPGSVMAEEEWGFTKTWEKAAYKDWANCYLRVKVDAAERTGDEIGINDWKTGKYRDQDKAQYEEQLHLYGTSTLTVFQHMPNLKVRARLVYVDTPVVYPPPIYENVYTQKDRVPMQKDWQRKIAPMFADKKFAPRPQFLCQWCKFRKEAGGPCQY